MDFSILSTGKMTKPSMENCELTETKKGSHATVTNEGHIDHFFGLPKLGTL